MRARERNTEKLLDGKKRAEGLPLQCRYSQLHICKMILSKGAHPMCGVGNNTL